MPLRIEVGRGVGLCLGFRSPQTIEQVEFVKRFVSKYCWRMCVVYGILLSCVFRKFLQAGMYQNVLFEFQVLMHSVL